MEYVEIELLGTDVPALRELGLPPSLEPTVECFQVTYFTGAPALGLLVDGRANPSRKALRRTAADAIGRSPLFVRGTALDADGVKDLDEVCCAHGLERLEGDVWGRPGFPGVPAPHASQLGVGLNAVTTFDGVSFKNTGDLGLYLEKSADFAAIARQLP